MPEWMILFIAADVVITVLVIVFVLRRRNLLGNSLLGGTASAAGFGDLMAFTREHHTRIGEFLKIQWSGAPEQLPAVLTALLAEMEQSARTRGLTCDRDTLKTVMASSIRAHRVARNRDLEEALRQVA